MSRLELFRTASAGTLESSDCMVTVSPASVTELEYKGANSGIFAERTEKLVAEVLKEYEVNGARVLIQDQGALGITIRARLETSLLRAGKEVS